MTDEEAKIILEGMLYMTGLSRTEAAAIKYCISKFREKENKDDEEED